MIIDTIYDNAMNFSCNINENYNDYEIKIPVPVKNLKEITIKIFSFFHFFIHD